MDDTERETVIKCLLQLRKHHRDALAEIGQALAELGYTDKGNTYSPGESATTTDGMISRKLRIPQNVVR